MMSASCLALDVPNHFTDDAASRMSMENNGELNEEAMDLRDEVLSTSMFEEIVGSSEAICRVSAHVMRVAPSDATVLITGESGTGKELIARAIYERSRRSRSAFTRMNFAVTPSSLMAAELFGYEKGAFTGANQLHAGRFEVANHGSIFLDEIGDMPGEAQVALLRVLQEQEFERRGHAKHSSRRACNCRYKLRSASGSSFRQVSSGPCTID
jgi:transcriptional regulator with GAF, ATPase, and Fis domain